MTQLGDFLAEYRKNHSLTLRDLAEKSGLSHAYIDKLEKGIDPRNGKPVIPTIDTLERIAKATGKTLQDILKISGYVSGELQGELDLDDILQKHNVQVYVDGEPDEAAKQDILDYIKFRTQQKRKKK